MWAVQFMVIGQKTQTYPEKVPTESLHLQEYAGFGWQGDGGNPWGRAHPWQNLGYSHFTVQGSPSEAQA